PAPDGQLTTDERTFLNMDAMQQTTIVAKLLVCRFESWQGERGVRRGCHLGPFARVRFAPKLKQLSIYTGAGTRRALGG
ncbi:hypothetical protein NY486_04825, partial [Enterobacter hormaechei]|nr:hypothetical protein [Enterobacter hormaechei]